MSRCCFFADLLTKTRIELQGGYGLDIYYNETPGKYGYTLIRQNQRIIGWDNAPHHPRLSGFPHHFHNEDGTVYPSDFTGNPVEDIVKAPYGFPSRWPPSGLYG